jgi:hypothetical protein
MSRIEDLTVEQNANLEVRINVLDNGTAKDLENHTVIAKMKKRYNSSTSIDFSTAIVFPPNTGIITISLDNTQTAGLDYNDRYVYDVIVVDSANTVERVVEGKVFVKPGVSSV